MHKGLACPLGKSLTRNGLIAFTIPPEVPSNLINIQTDLLKKAGLVDLKEANGLIASEFARSAADQLLVETDFADVDHLPMDLSSQLIQRINGVLGPNRTADDNIIRSYVNTDSIVTYQVFLTIRNKHVAIAGLPLRFYWYHANDGTAIVKKIDVFSTDWPHGITVADLGAKDPTTQYDYVTLYQTEGVLRQIALSNPKTFEHFLKKACDGAK